MAADADSARQLSESTEDDPSTDVDDLGQPSESAEAGNEESEIEDATQTSLPRLRLPIAFGLAVVLALGGLGGWLGYQAYQTHAAQRQSELFLQVGRQAALNLTTISHTEADADVQRILDSATGTFHDDFQQRAPAFVEVLKNAQSTTEGTITAAGVESEEADRAQVLVALSVKTSNAGAPEQQPRSWRMRITVQKVGDAMKAADVAFVP